jgi:hypothetical protein
MRTTGPGSSIREPRTQNGWMRSGKPSRHAATAKCADGQIDIDEFDERPDRSLAAKTRGDLVLVLADLPDLDRAGAVDQVRYGVLAVVAVIGLLVGALILVVFGA